MLVQNSMLRSFTVLMCIGVVLLSFQIRSQTSSTSHVTLNVPYFIKLCLRILHDDQVLRYLLNSPWQGQQSFEVPCCTDTVEMIILCTLPAALKNGIRAHSHEALRNGIGTHSCTVVAQRI